MDQGSVTEMTLPGLNQCPVFSSAWAYIVRMCHSYYGLLCVCQVASTLEKPPSLISASRYYDELPVGGQYTVHSDPLWLIYHFIKYV